MTFRFRRLERYRIGGTRDAMQLSVPRPRTPKGMVAQRCPADGCTPADFRIGAAEPERPEETATCRRPPGSPGVTCPYCGHDASDSKFTPRKDIDAGIETVRAAAMADVEEHFDALFRDMARKSGGMLKITTRRRPHAPRRVPLPQHKDLLRAVSCDICNRQYAVHGVGLFCPDCGSGNIHVHLSHENTLLLEDLAQGHDLQVRGEAEKAARRFRNAHEDVVSMAEGYLKKLFAFLVSQRTDDREEAANVMKQVRNSFQNVSRTRQRFAVFDFDPYGDLKDDDLRRFETLLEARHVVGHNLGVVDEKFARAGGTGRVGEDLSLDLATVEWFAERASTVVIYTARSFAEFRC